eukprot:CFRG5604T1
MKNSPASVSKQLSLAQSLGDILSVSRIPGYTKQYSSLEAVVAHGNEDSNVQAHLECDQIITHKCKLQQEQSLSDPFPSCPAESCRDDSIIQRLSLNKICTFNKRLNLLPSGDGMDGLTTTGSTAPSHKQTSATTLSTAHTSDNPVERRDNIENTKYSDTWSRNVNSNDVHGTEPAASENENENENERKKRLLSIVFDSLHSNLPHILDDPEPDYTLYATDLKFEENLSNRHITCLNLRQYKIVVKGFRLTTHCLLKNPKLEILTLRKIARAMEIHVRWRVCADKCAMRSLFAPSPNSDTVFDANSVFKVNSKGQICKHRCEKVIQRYDFIPEDDSPTLLQRLSRTIKGRGPNTPCPAYTKGS